MLRIKDAATAAEWSAFEGFLQLAALRRAHRRDIAGNAGNAGNAGTIVAALRGEQLRQPPAVTAVRAAAVSSPTVIIAALNGEIAAMKRQVTAYFGRHRDAAIYLSQPGTGEILGARLGEFGDDPDRYASARHARITWLITPRSRLACRRYAGPTP